MRIDSQLVRSLLRAQFPEYAHLPIAQVVPGGHDNRTFRVGEHVAARLPSAAPYAAHIPVEHEFLPRLARELPVRIPEPLGLGVGNRGADSPGTGLSTGGFRDNPRLRQTCATRTVWLATSRSS